MLSVALGFEVERAGVREHPRARMRIWALILVFVGLGLNLIAEEPATPISYSDIDEPPHSYKDRQPRDRFTRLKPDLEAGRIPLDTRGEKEFLLSLLKMLEIPVSSQMLVFSTTSLQLGLITPSNPRALYFNEDTYVGFIPGGRIEIISLDPELGAIFYIFDIPRAGSNPSPDRSGRCMNCHAGEETGQVPGLVVKSVIPGPGGGSLTAYRTDKTGHSIPFSERFGGWYVTGKHGVTNHLGNLTGRLSPEGLTKIPVVPGKLYAASRYPEEGSDILPQLIHEHQVGFVNRVVEAAYRARTAVHQARGRLTAAQREELDRQAEGLCRYLLFADEAKLPGNGVQGSARFKDDFVRTRKSTSDGVSLKDLKLTDRLFEYRCSYMIYEPSFQSLPREMRERVYRRMLKALDVERPDPEYAYLEAREKADILRILRATLPTFPR